MKTDEYRNYGNDSVRFINHVWLWEEIVMSKWIPLYQGCEIPDGDVLCINTNDICIIGHIRESDVGYTGFIAESDTGIMYNVDSWMPLPKRDNINPHTKKVIV